MSPDAREFETMKQYYVDISLGPVDNPSETMMEIAARTVGEAYELALPIANKANGWIVRVEQKD